MTWSQTAEMVVRQSGKQRGKYFCGKLYRSVTALGRYYALLSYMRLIDPDFSVYKSADGQYHIGLEKKTGCCRCSWEADVHISLAATAEPVHPAAVHSASQ